MVFKQYEENIQSQNGEDGVIREIFNRLSPINNICVEFGAWDGKHLSNTWNLWYNDGWKALLIEGCRTKYQDLLKSTSAFPNVTAIQKMVETKGENSLDNILKQHNIPSDFDLLSIDIDGDEYYILKNLNDFQPRIIIIEYNPTIPPIYDIVQQQGEYFGASALAIFNLAFSKGYSLIHLTTTNLFFIRQELFNQMNIPKVSLNELFKWDRLSYLFTSYAGHAYISSHPTYLRENDLLHFSPTNHSPITVKNELDYSPLLITKNMSFNTPESMPSPKKRTIIFRSLNMLRKIKTKMLKTLKQRIITLAWVFQGCPTPPPHAYKQKMVISHGRKYHCKTLVETGTFLGQMVQICLNNFQQIKSIELDDKLYNQNKESFKYHKHVEIIQGDSGEALPDIIKDIDHACLFWLDGHYSAGITAKGELNTPILKELATISEHPIKNHVILIDDARAFNGKNDYPTITELKDIATKFFPKNSFKVKNDIIRIEPIQ